MSRPDITLENCPESTKHTPSANYFNVYYHAPHKVCQVFMYKDIILNIHGHMGYMRYMGYMGYMGYMVFLLYGLYGLYAQHIILLNRPAGMARRGRKRRPVRE
jgi:hypothetical protein